METEIWPNLLVACCNKKIPAMLLNARMSQKSQRGYARFAPVRALTRNALRSLCGVAAQSEGDAQRFTDLGATNVSVTGNVKFDIAVDLALVAQGQRWRQEVAGTRQVLLAASTRDGEEALLLDAYCRVFLPAERAGVLLIIVPRHPARFDAVESLIRARGLDAGRRGVQQTGNACDVWLGDSMGEMPAYIAMCDLAFIGGSLLPLGGHNLIEACAQGKTVLMGPSTFNFAEAARLATAAGAMQQVADADAVMAAAKALLGDEHLQLTASRAALAFARAHAGATGKTMALINPLLAALPTANQPN